MSENINIKFKALTPLFQLPKQATPGAAGFDMRAILSAPRTVMPGETVLIDLGCSVEIPEGYEIQVRPRSGLALKYGITVLNSPGTIDSDYRGPCGCIIHNASKDAFTISPDERICQFVVQKVPQVSLELVENLTDTTRGEGGFGSTGRI